MIHQTELVSEVLKMNHSLIDYFFFLLCGLLTLFIKVYYCFCPFFFLLYLIYTLFSLTHLCSVLIISDKVISEIRLWMCRTDSVFPSHEWGLSGYVCYFLCFEKEVVWRVFEAALLRLLVQSKGQRQLVFSISTFAAQRFALISLYKGLRHQWPPQWTHIYLLKI